MDRIVHEPSRLSILTALKARTSLSFRDLKGITQLTDGMLSAQTKKLEEAGYLKIDKQFVGRKPQTTYSITENGNKAFDDYIKEMEVLIAKVNEQHKEG